MKFGLSIVFGPIKLFLGTPCCRLEDQSESRPSRRPRASREAIIAPTKPTARGTASTVPTFQLDPQVRNDSILALVTLGFPKRQAQSRVDAITAGTTTEDIIKAALQGGC